MKKKNPNYYVLKKMPVVLRENKFKVKCVVSKNERRTFVYDIVGIVNF